MTDEIVDEQKTETTGGNELPDWANDPAAAFKMVNDLRAENARDRTAAKDAAANAAKAELLKSLGLKEDDKPVTPEDHQRALAERDERIRNLTVKSALTDALNSANAKPIARAAILGDDILAGLDASSDTFANDVAAKVSEYITANPELAKTTAQAAASSSSTDRPGGNASMPTFTRAQLRDHTFYKANKAEIEAAYLDGRITD